MDQHQEGFSQVAITLINHYDCVHYVDLETGKYTNLVPIKLFETLGVPFQGEDFFSDFRKILTKCIHPNDIELLEHLLDKNLMKKRLLEKDTNFLTFRAIKEGKAVHIRHSEFLCPDKIHVICCLENIEEEFQQAMAQKNHLESEKRLARFDEMTGVRNKNAFKEYSNSINEKLLKNPKSYQFALILCDMNDLKLINDTRGHSFGDEAIQTASRMICNTFTHSPVFRIGGDEFVVVLKGHDFAHREHLLEVLKDESYNNKISRSGPVIACGIAVYDPDKDKDFSSVLDRADKSMYANKKEIKALNLTQGYRNMGKIGRPITSERKTLLNSLFGALCTISGGGYVYLNDMRFDYSRLSLSLVDDFAMPSEYMYHADKLWQEKLHPDDLQTYLEAINAVLCDNADMIKPLSYRAKKADGTYTVLTTRGFILSDTNGNPDYFGGIILSVQ